MGVTTPNFTYTVMKEQSQQVENAKERLTQGAAAVKW